MNSPKALSNKETYSRPDWIDADAMEEEELCPECFKAVGVKSRYKIICELGKKSSGATVTVIAKVLGLTQPTVTHHLNILKSIKAVNVIKKGRERVYLLNRNAHCFEECKIPY